MRLVKIAAGFTGYPSGAKRHFSKGRHVSLANAYAGMLIDKGLAFALPRRKEMPAAKAQAQAKDRK